MDISILTYYTDYSPIGDIMTMALCLVLVVIIRTAYINRTKSFLFIRFNIFLLFLAAMSDIIYHTSMNNIDTAPISLIYITRSLFHLCLYGELLMYVFYMKEPMRLDNRSDRRFALVAAIGYVIFAVLEVLGIALKFSFYIEDRVPRSGFPIFPFGYAFYIGMLTYMVIKYRNRVFKQIIMGICFTSAVSFLIILLQQKHGQSSFTVFTFAFPIYALLYLVHSNPYNLESGALSRAAFDDYIRSNYERKRELLLMSLYMTDFDSGEHHYPSEILEMIRYFVVHFFKGATLFQISGGHLLLIVDIRKNPSYAEVEKKMLDAFDKIYPIYRRDYKIISLTSNDELSAENDYIGLFHFLHGRMPINTIHFVDEKDFKNYRNYKYIISELKDIKDTKDMNDPRVEVYCQPVFNISLGIYDTAEALMRLRLPELGMVFPDQFIPVAEQIGCIQILTRIILNKTCRQIATMTRHGYSVRRISVNFSIFDVKESDFCAMVEDTINRNGISSDKVAIEITESQNEYDFEVIKEKINALKGSGIKFYLDDFGTGYSNFERIMELPFDIIKFDRSLVIASSNDQKIREMVTHLAKMFNDMDYAVLYEGIEDEDDEARCIDMSAKYLQGYKYSKPIPIKELTDYFEKIG